MPVLLLLADSFLLDFESVRLARCCRCAFHAAFADCQPCEGCRQIPGNCSGRLSYCASNEKSAQRWGQSAELEQLRRIAIGLVVANIQLRHSGRQKRQQSRCLRTSSSHVFSNSLRHSDAPDRASTNGRGNTPGCRRQRHGARNCGNSDCSRMHRLVRCNESVGKFERFLERQYSFQFVAAQWERLAELPLPEGLQTLILPDEWSTDAGRQQKIPPLPSSLTSLNLASYAASPLRRSQTAGCTSAPHSRKYRRRRRRSPLASPSAVAAFQSLIQQVARRNFIASFAYRITFRRVLGKFRSAAEAPVAPCRTALFGTVEAIHPTDCCVATADVTHASFFR